MRLSGFSIPTFRMLIWKGIYPLHSPELANTVDGKAGAHPKRIAPFNKYEQLAPNKIVVSSSKAASTRTSRVPSVIVGEVEPQLPFSPFEPSRLESIPVQEIHESDACSSGEGALGVEGGLEVRDGGEYCPGTTMGGLVLVGGVTTACG